MTNALAITQTNNLLMQHIDTNNSVQLSRLNQFDQWLTDNARNILNANLADYRDYLLHERGLSPNSVSSHLSTLRGAYQRLLADNRLRDYLYAQADDTDSKADKKAFVDELIVRLSNISDSKNSTVKVENKQDSADSDHVRLTMLQVKQLLQKTLDTSSQLVGLRDCALISLALATGAREMELVNLTVADLRQKLGGKLALRVRLGKGNKTRLIPYGQFSNALIAVDRWLQAAQITEGYVFRSLDRHGNTRDSMTTRAVIKVLKRYPVMMDGKLTTVNPHDLRRTYAKLLYNGGMDLVSIQQNLGHASMDTTLKYIGTMDADKREPSMTLPIPLQLEQAMLTQKPLNI